ncbi:hypothetical protein GPALN_012346 [Globodera pallida]|nr:hypothetical protein GPALN_012346 [Globodera pallida]
MHKASKLREVFKISAAPAAAAASLQKTETEGALPKFVQVLADAMTAALELRVGATSLESAAAGAEVGDPSAAAKYACFRSEMT